MLSSADIVYVIDWFMGFHIGFVASWDARWVPVTDGRLVAKYYALHGQLIINTVAMLPIIVQVSAAPGRVMKAGLQLALWHCQGV